MVEHSTENAGVTGSIPVLGTIFHSNRRTALIVLLLIGAACRNIDVVTGSYATIAEARTAGAVDRGWIPRWLPPASHDIREAHDLDTNRRWGIFSFPVSDEADLRSALQPDEVSLVGRTCDVPGRIEWWPVLLRNELDADRIHTTGLRAYRSREGNLLVLVNWNQRRAYYWTVDNAPG